ncbi:hypothetical protein Pan153_36060 [Gimesia panareensis]|uniref:Knr4/Smi1-like domain-containing protein n=1 Tax=Gimesia panareensis TaxID=2527978 RepID=A0A518FRK9_9PLAN|nr:SMI1/KNR4 family protein [Gimesia panareensis]QDV18945.1 hypothetical protein Pan153_36060 [Gimesia panareensis]
MSISKPVRQEEMLPPFEKIGEENWSQKLRKLLNSFDIPLPAPVSSAEIQEREQALALTFPVPLKTFLLEFGPISFDYVELLPPSQISRATELWFADKLDENPVDYLIVANAGGPDNQFVIELKNGHCLLARHDSAKLESCVTCFDDLIRISCIGLYTGYYGWDDLELVEMQSKLMQELFGVIL